MEDLTKRDRLLVNRIKARLEKELGQAGGACRLSSSGSFGNVAGQLGCMVRMGVGAIVKGVDSAYSVITLPSDLAWDFERPNEPMPSNTPIEK